MCIRDSLSWTKKIKHPSEVTEIGAPIDVQVLDIDKGGRRLSLGHKQLEENPWDVFETIFTVGSVHEGTIVELLDKGAVISLPYEMCIRDRACPLLIWLIEIVH